MDASEGSVKTAFFYVELLKGKADAQAFAVRVAQAASKEAISHAGAYFFFFF